MKPAPGDLFAFANEVHVDGYEILEADTQPGRSTSAVLTGRAEREIVPLGRAVKPCQPLAESKNIAREFRDVGRSDAELVEFVNRFGLLWPAGHPRNTVERFREMQKATASVLTDIKRARDAGAAYKKRETLRELAVWFNQVAAPSFAYRLKFETAKTADRALRVEPASLMSAIGLMLAYEISGEIEWGTCANCGSPFPKGAPGDRVRRRDAATCSQECTQALLDERKATKRAAHVFKPRACLHCGEMFTPKRESTEHCGKAACKQAVHRMRSKPAASAKQSKPTKGASK
ncbi:hypothetical protein [Ralstonia pseudosolanacearum]|uniref:hypothetical protein n=1 Tax=Ralstonia pseudosolanacearum TaxID=1310165 RepID=UPI00201E2682|nr:hypothetical protein [Ralstonia pseudosolanacearum]UQY83666.1 hypothetical protein JNO62_05980 [Ralstonia pseudosolanacearum]